MFGVYCYHVLYLDRKKKRAGLGNESMMQSRVDDSRVDQSKVGASNATEQTTYPSAKKTKKGKLSKRK